MSTCRTCYMRDLPTVEERARFAAEPVTMPIHYCPEHEQRAKEIEALFAKAVAEGTIVRSSTATGRIAQFPRETGH